MKTVVRGEVMQVEEITCFQVQDLQVEVVLFQFQNSLCDLLVRIRAGFQVVSRGERLGNGALRNNH